MSSELSLVVGDVLKVERRFVVDGTMKRAVDQGTFAGVQVVGSAEHLVLEGGRKGTTRLVPLHSVSEITLVKAMPRKPREAPAAPSWDPSVA